MDASLPTTGNVNSSVKAPAVTSKGAQGLQSLACAASKIVTVDLLDDTGDRQVIEIVDTEVNVGNSHHLKDAYTFKGQSKLSFKVTTGKKQQKGNYNAHMTPHISGFCELPLHHFGPWFKGFRFAPFVTTPEDEVWKWMSFICEA